MATQGLCCCQRTRERETENGEGKTEQGDFFLERSGRGRVGINKKAKTSELICAIDIQQVDTTYLVGVFSPKLIILKMCLT